MKSKVKVIEMMGKKNKKVESFKYLGSVMTSLNDIETEIKSKIAVGKKCYYALGPILRRRSVSQSIKICLYKTIIRPAVTYGAETWTVTYGVETGTDIRSGDRDCDIWSGGTDCDIWSGGMDCDIWSGDMDCDIWSRDMDCDK
jgi:hypothetical protein